MDRDFGYSKIEWRDANLQNLTAVESEYRKRLGVSAAAWSDLDQKARFLFSGLTGLNSALVGLTLGNAGGIEQGYFVALMVLAVMFSAAICASAFSLMPRQYTLDGGVTPSDLDVSGWEPLLMRDDSELRQLSGV